MAFSYSATTRVLAAFSIAAACALVGGCSSSTPSLFPAVLADPPQRSDTTLSPEQVKLAVDNLVSERNRLCMETVANEGAGAKPPDCGAQTAAGTTPNTGVAAKP
jgi:hypothetical protein